MGGSTRGRTDVSTHWSSAGTRVSDSCTCRGPASGSLRRAGSSSWRNYGRWRSPNVRSRISRRRSGRWREGLTAEKMKECVWVRPELVAEVEFVEWTPDGHLRHARFVGMREG